MKGAGPRPGTRRRPPRFPVMLRTRSSALVASGAGLMVAAILGVQLGQSAVSEIDPVHFQGPAERPVGIDPAAARAAAPDSYSQAFSQDYVWGDSGAPGPICGGDCEARDARTAAALDGPVATRELSAPYWRDVTPTTELRPWQPGQIPQRGLSVERYMHYPVNAEQAAEPVAPEPVAPEPAAPAPPAAPVPGEEPVDD